MVENVRLVIWDLDETFWRGTLTEGGCSQEPQNIEIVKELTRRGIVNSICSKNDHDTVRKLLQDWGIWEYFIFPSIDWSPKAQRIANIIDTIGLRAPTVLFCDDNHLNREEVKNFVSGIQVEDEFFISKMLADPRFSGNPNDGGDRLKRYKLIEERHHDQISTADTNSDFLRGCNIRVSIEYDLRDHYGRIHELLNRTNQLNFTKRRLSEDPREASVQIDELLSDHFKQCGLVRVHDRYGDYGYVGFFCLEGGILNAETGSLAQRLVHFCFSCRTLGMGIEAWLFQHLQRPMITVQGDVVTNLLSYETVDWITLEQDANESEHTATVAFDRIVVHGGCEANALGHYLGNYAANVEVTGNFHAGVAFYRVNASSIVASMQSITASEASNEASALGVPAKMLQLRRFATYPEGTLFVIGLQMDRPHTTRHVSRNSGLEIFIEPHGLWGRNIFALSDIDAEEILAAQGFTNSALNQVVGITRHMRESFENRPIESYDVVRDELLKLIDSIPKGTKIIVVCDHDRVRLDDDRVVDAPWAREHFDFVKETLFGRTYAGVATFKQAVSSDDEIHRGGNHYDRLVYLRLAERIVSLASTLEVR